MMNDSLNIVIFSFLIAALIIVAAYIFVSSRVLANRVKNNIKPDTKLIRNRTYKTTHFKKGEMVKKESWDTFRSTGLPLFINQFLHIFGWSLVFEIDKHTKEVITIYPARVKFRGFSDECTSQAYKEISNYMASKSEELLEEVEED